MPTPTYTAIASTTLGSAASTVALNNLGTAAAGMRDLIVVFQTRLSAVEFTNIQIRLNADSTASAYHQVYIAHLNGSNATNNFAGTSVELPIQFEAGNDMIGQLTIFDFSQTDKHKAMIIRADRAGSEGGTSATAARWANTSAVTSVNFSILKAGTNFAAGSTFSVYGVIA